ncbi:hypothetical protein CC80DRAFT_598012 [Byssothecium circinans]|uniref:Uncharacterized protein n=1 Tax=Byssothecium circinans TaxID=147558 RepID=A0A6A5TD96_9PLEO|nr:hypothetical protein CC80DRAFT_598012 [Byssothecium circinans]
MTPQNSPRRGHMGIKAILDDMVTVLPPEATTNPAYTRIHTTFGLLQRTIKNAEDTSTHSPEKQYKELSELEKVLRKRLTDLKARKGIPEKMQSCLDELRDAVAEALEQGVTVDWMIKGFEEMVEAPVPTLEERARMKPEKYVKESMYKKVWDECKAEKEKNRVLNRENNELVMRVKRLESEISGLKGAATKVEKRSAWGGGPPRGSGWNAY